VCIVTRSLTRYFDISALVRFNRQRYPYALVSSALQLATENPTLHASIGRYDIVFACPQEILQYTSDGVLCYTDAHARVLAKKPQYKHFLDELELCCSQEKKTRQVDDATCNGPLLPFSGGWFVYLAYEMAAQIEPCLHLPQSHSRLPQAIATRIPAAIIRDRINQTCTLVAEKAYAALLTTIEADIRQLLQDNPSAQQSTATVDVSGLQEAEEKPYLAQVERIKQYIYDGDIFQANLSRAWTTRLEGPPRKRIDDYGLFQRLAQHNPASFAALVSFQHGAIISSSPERLVSMKNRVIETRPIAGTRPRSTDSRKDRALAEELLAHPKEQAEHIMLIDLERNDLGRVCVPGSIHVNELMGLESWQHVHHIVSNIQGRCRHDRSSIDVLKAVFPGGTITGCPKLRCMEILAEQEMEARGAYTGSLGYINHDGDMDFNILIRTLVREHDKLYFRAGGGIVADSQASHELAETRAKACGLIKIFQSEL